MMMMMIHRTAISSHLRTFAELRQGGEAYQKQGKMPLPRPYSSSGAGSRVVLRHRAAAAACACLTVDAVAAYCTPDDAAKIGPADVFLHNHCPNSWSFTKDFFSNIIFYNNRTTIFSQKTILTIFPIISS